MLGRTLGTSSQCLVVRLANQGENAAIIDTKLSALAFGLFVPVFFIVSGIAFGLNALTDSAGTPARVPRFLVVFLVVRGIPTLISYRNDSCRAIGSQPRSSRRLHCPSSLRSRRSGSPVTT